MKEEEREDVCTRGLSRLYLLSEAISVMVRKKRPQNVSMDAVFLLKSVQKLKTFSCLRNIGLV